MKSLLIILIITNILFAKEQKQYKLEGLTQISNKLAIETLKNSDLNSAIKDFFSFGYFDDIEAFTEKNNSIIIKFTEKPFIVNITMEGYKTRDEDLELLYSAMQIKKGTMYTKEKIDLSKKILLNELKKEGYVNSVVEVEVEQLSKDNIAIKYSVNKGSEIIIKKVNYLGAKQLNSSLFKEVTANKKEDLISWWFGNSDGVMQMSQLEFDSLRIKDLYYQYGYLDARVDLAFSKIDANTNTAEVDFNIFEGDQYKLADITINIDNDIISSKELKKGLTSRDNKVFNISDMRQDVNFIKTKVLDKGYAFAQVNYDIKKNKEDMTAIVIFNIIPGKKVYINDVIISGNTRTLDRVVRRSVYLAPQDLFNLTDLKDSKNQLSRTGYFEKVNITQKRITDELINIEVKVNEAPTGNLIFGGGYGSYDGFLINASIQDKNIFGSGMNLGLSFEHSQRKDLGRLSLTNPSINDSPYNGSLSIYKEENIIAASTDSTLGDQTTNLKGASIGIGRNLNRNTKIGMLYAIEDSEVLHELNSSQDEIYVTSSLTPYINYDNTDDFYLPRKGIKTGYSFKFVGIGGDAKYSLHNAYFKYFHGLKDYIEWDWIFRFKTTLKYIQDRGNIPNDTTFYLGGSTSVRGFESYAFQPEDGAVPFKRLSTNTVELSFPLIEKAKMRWALFYDYGMIGQESFSDIQKSGYGISVNWFSPVGPVQFIFSKALNPDPDDKLANSVEFSLGTSF